MKILFLSSWYPWPADNGSKIRVYHLLQALGRRHDVTLMAFAFATARADQPEPLHFCSRIETIQVDPHMEAQASTFRRFLSPAPLVARPLPAMAQRVQEVLASSNFDVVIASTETMAAYALAAPARSARLLEEHNSFSRMMFDRYRTAGSRSSQLRRWASWQKTRRFEAKLFRQFDLVTMVSEQDQQASLKSLSAHDTRVEVVPNGVDCSQYRPGMVSPRPDMLIFSGALSYDANYDALQYFLTDIYPMILQRRPGVSLEVTGSLAGVNTAALPHHPSIQFTGYVDDIKSHVASAAVCVVPLRQGGGSRLKILEAMALGTPVVATSKGAEGLAAIDGQHLLLADSPEAFAQNTLALLENEELRQRLTGNARRLVEICYDWNDLGRRFVELVEEVAEGRRRLQQ